MSQDLSNEIFREARRINTSLEDGTLAGIISSSLKDGQSREQILKTVSEIGVQRTAGRNSRSRGTGQSELVNLRGRAVKSEDYEDVKSLLDAAARVADNSFSSLEEIMSSTKPDSQKTFLDKANAALAAWKSIPQGAGKLKSHLLGIAVRYPWYNGKGEALRQNIGRISLYSSATAKQRLMNVIMEFMGRYQQMIPKGRIGILALIFRTKAVTLAQMIFNGGGSGSDDVANWVATSKRGFFVGAAQAVGIIGELSTGEIAQVPFDAYHYAPLSNLKAYGTLVADIMTSASNFQIKPVPLAGSLITTYTAYRWNSQHPDTSLDDCFATVKTNAKAVAVFITMVMTEIPEASEVYGPFREFFGEKWVDKLRANNWSSGDIKSNVGRLDTLDSIIEEMIGAVEATQEIGRSSVSDFWNLRKRR
jgi:hypothetical protein